MHDNALELAVGLAIAHERGTIYRCLGFVIVFEESARRALARVYQIGPKPLGTLRLLQL